MIYDNVFAVSWRERPEHFTVFEFNPTDLDRGYWVMWDIRKIGYLEQK